MKIGTKSLLFGAHQIFWHPYVVYKAWKYLYGRPTWKEFVCIFIHDWGYWGKPDLDGEEGMLHPELGGKIANRLFGIRYWKLCAGHSRSYVEEYNKDQRRVLYRLSISKLCWADKLSFTFEPRWFYLLRARLSGEIKEIRINSVKTIGCPLNLCDEAWFDMARRCAENSIPLEIYYNSRKIHKL